MAHILCPLPSRDFDPSEVGVTWKVLTAMGHRVTFATPDGLPAACDPIMISGRGLDPWSNVPVLGKIRILGLMLRANKAARTAYRAMTQDAAFLHPIRWTAIDVSKFDGLFLGGGHRARGMREYLESPILQGVIASFFAMNKPVGAICHGVLLAARSTQESGKSVLYGRKTTSLTWVQEKTASAFAHVGRFWDRNYYRTYIEEPGQTEGFLSVQQEVTRALEKPTDFVDVPGSDPLFKVKTSGLSRDTAEDDRPAWVVRDGNYLSARWPGDVHTFARDLGRLLREAA